MPWPKGRRAHNWKGGRVVDPRGYVLIFVGKGDPLADVRGYAYEHRIAAQKMVDRPLTSTDIVIRSGEVTTRKVLAFRRRLPGSHAKMPGTPNPIVRCKCGCGAKFLKFDRSNRPRQFVAGHNLRSANGR